MLRYKSTRLLALNTHALAPVDVVKKLGILRRPRYVHRGSRRGFIYSNNNGESSIPSVWSPARSVADSTRHQSAENIGLVDALAYGLVGNPEVDPNIPFPASLNGTRKGGKPGVDFSALRPLTKLKPSSHIKLVQLNAQSLTNKACLLHSHILDNRIDLMCVTETWHRPEQYSVLNEACPAGYTYLEKARTTVDTIRGPLAQTIRLPSVSSAPENTLADFEEVTPQEVEAII
uniref:Uncharacterized protein n=1 Tax=Knipowitschia caucasica TaxID=637954 RepID=A0AAV2L2I5_KNICA